MGYCILNYDKRKLNDTYGREKHDNRTKESYQKTIARAVANDKVYNENIDINKTDSNVYFKKSSNWYADIKKITDDYNVKRRADAVAFIDCVYTASPDFFIGKTKKEIEEFFKDCQDFHLRRFCNNDDNLLLNSVIHYDETTPHLHIVSVPIIKRGEGYSLSAKELLGNRGTYTKTQDNFYEEVGKKHNLNRGITQDKGKQMKHKTTLEHDIEIAEKELATIQAKLELEIDNKIMQAIEKAEQSAKDAEKSINFKTIEHRENFFKLPEKLYAMDEEEFNRLRSNYITKVDTYTLRSELRKLAAESNQNSNISNLLEEVNRMRTELNRAKQTIDNLEKDSKNLHYLESLCQIEAPHLYRKYEGHEEIEHYRSRD